MFGGNPYGGGYGVAAMVGDMDAEKNRMAVQHSFSSSFFSFFSLLSAVALYKKGE